jgi:hypothetical protein
VLPAISQRLHQLHNAGENVGVIVRIVAIGKNHRVSGNHTPPRNQGEALVLLIIQRHADSAMSLRTTLATIIKAAHAKISYWIEFTGTVT